MVGLLPARGVQPGLPHAGQSGVEAQLQGASYSHPHKPKRWIIDQYFGAFASARKDQWVFGDHDSGAYLLNFAWTKMRCPPCGDLLLHAEHGPRHPDEWEQWITAGGKAIARQTIVDDETPGRRPDAPLTASSTPTADAANQMAPAASGQLSFPPERLQGLLEPVTWKADTPNSRSRSTCWKPSRLAGARSAGLAAAERGQLLQFVLLEQSGADEEPVTFRGLE